MNSYDTLTAALNDLNNRGFSVDFNMNRDSIYCKSLGEAFGPDDFEIIEFYRFEGNTDPADQSIVYALETRSGLKGVLVDAYGVYADPMTTQMIQKLKTH